MLRYFGYAEKFTVARFVTQKPVVLTHFLTSKCNCKCKICDIWRKDSAQEMEPAQIQRILNEAKKLNFAVYVMWGGEPLLRADSLEIMEYAHKLGLYTSLITNGTLLPKKAKEVAKHVDLTWVSLDYPSDFHDELRGLKGTFGNAVEGIKKLKKHGGTVAVNCVLSKLNNHKSIIRDLASLAEKLQVRIAFDPMEVFAGFNDEHALSSQERRESFSEILQLKKLGFPILNSYEFINQQINPIKYSCAQPQILVNVSASGEVFPFWCRKTDKVLGDLRKQSLGEILHSAAYKGFMKKTGGCHLCNNSVTVETSFFYTPKTTLFNCFRSPNLVLEFISFYGNLTLSNIALRKKKLP
jgi:MoaA/NifB/PqqE/SkfB family radical SAM enzyme